MNAPLQGLWTSRWLVAAAVGLAAMVLAAGAGLALHEREEVLKMEVQRQTVLARVLEEHATRSIDSTLLALRSVADQVTAQTDPEITQAALPREVIDASWKNLEFTWDPVASSLKTSADNAYALGFLGLKKPDLSKIYDLTILNRVLKALNLSEAKGF